MNSANNERPKPSPPRQTEQILLFTVANQILAISTNAVREIRSTDSMAGTATEIQNSEIPAVRHTIQRGQRTYYVVNAASHFRLPLTRPSLVLILRDSRAVVLIDRIERMAEISVVHRLPPAFSGEERRWYRGLTYVDDRVIPLLDSAAFLSGDDIRRLDSVVASISAQREAERAVHI